MFTILTENCFDIRQRESAVDSKEWSSLTREMIVTEEFGSS